VRSVRVDQLAGSARVRAVSAGVSVAALCGWLFTNIGAAALPLARAYGISLGVVGVMAAAVVAVHALLQLPAGELIDKVGARRALLLGCALVLVSNAAALIVPVAALAVAMRLLCGVGTALCYLGGSVSITSVDRSPLAQGLFGAGAPVGSAMALALIPALDRAIGWRASWLTAVAAAGIVLLAVAFLAPQDGPRAQRRNRSSLRGVLADARLYRLGAVHGASFGLSVVVGSWTVAYLEQRDGSSPAAAGVVAALVLGGSALTRWLGGLASDASRLRLVLVASMVAGGAGVAALAVAGSLPLAAGAALLIGLASGVPFATVFSLAQVVRPAEGGASLALVNALGNGVLVVGVPLLGVAFTFGEERLGLALIAVAWLCTILVVPRVAELRAGQAALWDVSRES